MSTGTADGQLTRVWRTPPLLFRKPLGPGTILIRLIRRMRVSAVQSRFWSPKITVSETFWLSNALRVKG